MKVKVKYYYIITGNCFERTYKLPFYYNDKRIRSFVLNEVMRCSGYDSCRFSRPEFIDNAFDVYETKTDYKVLEVCWLTDFSIIDRLKFKLFPIHYAKKGASKQ